MKSDDAGAAAPDTENSRERIEAWAVRHLHPVAGSTATWERDWPDSRDIRMLKMRVMLHGSGAWIILGSCSMAYAGNEENWELANFGDVRSISDLKAIYEWFSSCE